MVVDLSRTGLADLPLPETLRHAVELNLSWNRLSALPSDIGILHRLRALNLSGNKLSHFPLEVCSLVSLEELDISRNEIPEVPAAIGRLTRLRSLNLMCNWIGRLPREIGALRRLARLGLKSNRLERLPPEIGELVELTELFLSDNQIFELPSTIGGLRRLTKLQLSWNRLETLPQEIGSLHNLELIRIAVNRIHTLPHQLHALPRLAWLSLAGNPISRCKPTTHKLSSIRALDFPQLQVTTVLGKGASGDVFLSVLDGEAVAVKVFNSEVSPDGHAMDEIAVTECLDHPNLSKVLGDTQTPHAIVLRFVNGSPVAEPPNMASLLRCRWKAGTVYSVQWVVSVGACVASALAYMHSKGICHGDVYAHNVLADSEGNAVLCDYGASFFYDDEGCGKWEAMEVRAFGLFMEALVRRTVQENGHRRRALHGIVSHCLHKDSDSRPGFPLLATELERLLRP